MSKRVLALVPAVLFWTACGGEPIEPSALDGVIDAMPVAEAPGDAPEVAATGPDGHAVVRFGRGEVGTVFFPPGSHDGSFHAKDAIRPRRTVISAGGTVDFVIATFHKPAVYEPGIGVEDIDVTLLEEADAPFEFPPIINDPEGRIARGDLNVGAPKVWSWTFEEPGLYLVICEVLPHFAGAKMYAWVDVR